MATSATQLSLIIKTLCTEFELNEKQVLKQLSNQDLLPAKLNKPDVKKSFSIFASKHAEELAAVSNIVPDGNGSGKDGKFTLNDIKKIISGTTIKEKLIISPIAQKYATDNNISLEDIKGSGKDGRILLKDFEVIKDSALNISTRALQEAKDSGMTEEKLRTIIGSGKDGRILLTDIKNNQKTDSDTEEDESDEE